MTNSEELLEQSDLLRDAPALAVLHSSKYRDFIPIIVSRFNVHVTIFSLVEFAASIYYTRKTPPSTSIMQVMRKIYNVIDTLDDALIEKIAMLMGELTHYSIPATFEDVANVVIALQRKMVLVTGDPERYTGLEKYGAIILNVEELIQSTEEFLEREIKP